MRGAVAAGLLTVVMALPGPLVNVTCIGNVSRARERRGQREVDDIETWHFRVRLHSHDSHHR